MTQLAALLGAGFGLGLLHALDADHVMALSTLGNQRPTPRQTLRFAAHWSWGHGGVLLLAGALLMLLDYRLPLWVSALAEQLVGVMLIALGSLLLWRLRREGLVLSQHQHGELAHTHWHDSQHSNRSLPVAKHTPVLVGVLHGLAGSAPALAMLPALASGRWAFLYLLLFSFGVMLSMLLLGLLWGRFQQRLHRRSEGLLRGLRQWVASAAIVLGCYWLLTV